MARFDDYATKYQTIRMERRDGILRYTRVLFTQPLKKQLVDYLGYGLALEGLSVVDRTVTPGT